MSKKKFRVAIATKGRKGLKDNVSEVFGRANTFTIVEVEDDEIKDVEIIGNPAAAYKYGAGPIVVKELMDLKVDLVIAPEFGPGASAILAQHHVAMIIVKTGAQVADAVENARES